MSDCNCQVITGENESDYAQNQQALLPQLLPAIVAPPVGLFPYNYLACDGIVFAAPVISGGGDTFDCLNVSADVGFLVPSPGYEFPQFIGGNGFSGGWEWGDSPFGNVFGDEFQGYAEGVVSSGTLSGGTGMSGSWFVGDGP